MSVLVGLGKLLCGVRSWRGSWLVLCCFSKRDFWANGLGQQLLFTPAMLGFVLTTSGGLWLLTTPLRHWGYEVPWRTLLEFSALALLEALRMFPWMAPPEVFFYVLGCQNKSLAEQLRSLPGSSLKRQLGHWAYMAAIGGGALLALLLAAPLLGSLPFVAALAGALLASWYLVLPLLLLGGLLLWALGGAYLFLRPFQKLFAWDPALCWVAVAAVCLRVLSIASLGGVVKGATVMYYSCTLLTADLLAPFATRRPEQWPRFQKTHRLEMFGFGLPVWLLLQQMPLLVVVLLQGIQGVAATLLNDLLEEDES
ncbi:unnamed protein product, partial [Effrenium voratum]